MRFCMGLALMLVVGDAIVRANEPAKQAAQNEPAKPAAAANAQVDAGEMVQRISRALLSKADIKADKAPLSKFVEGLAKQYKVPFKIDEPALKAAGIKLDVPVTATIKTGTLNQALRKILTDLDLRWVLHDTEVFITAIPQAQARAEREIRAVAAVPVQVEQQFVPQFRALFKAELYFIGKVCQPTKEQMDAIAATAAATSIAASKRYGEHNGRFGQGRGLASVSSDPRSILQESLLPVLKTNLKPEQLARYVDEADQRHAAKRSMAVHNLIAKLDRDLLLSAQQREELEASLTSKWDRSWCQSAQMLMNLDQFFPAIPDEIVTPHLNARQQEIWRGMRKQQGNVFFGGGFGLFGNEVDETVWGEDAKE
jgi:hypothetical protein